MPFTFYWSVSCYTLHSPLTMLFFLHRFGYCFRMASDSNQGAGFKIHTDDSSFQSRSTDVFSALETLEEKQSATKRVRDRSRSKNDDDAKLWRSDPDTNFPSQSRHQRHSDRHGSSSGHRSRDRDYYRSSSRRDDHDRSGSRHQTRGSDFKAPSWRPRRARHMPDYKKNPGKWTRYDLDIPEEDTSERSNSAAAFAFLQERKKLKQQEEQLEDGEDEQKIVFKKSSSRKRSADTSQESQQPTVIKSGKVVMPEYVVGEKVAKKSSKPTKSSTAGSSACNKVGLGHLAEEEEEEQDESTSSPSLVKFKSRKVHKGGIRSRTEEKDDE